MPQVKDMTGKEFDRLTVLELAGRDKHRRALWKCRCKCGNVIFADGGSLRSRNTRSCGCLHIDTITTHGESRVGQRTAEYSIWRNIISRCTKPENKDWDNYGGRGIKLCDRWMIYENFLADVGRRPSRKHTLDRRDNDGNYEPKNVRWATHTEQMRNSRRNRIIELDGVRKCAIEWAEEFDIHPATLHSRLRIGMSVKQALTTPTAK